MPRRGTRTLDLTRRRDASLSAVPYRLDVVRREEKSGKLYLTVRFVRPRWQRVLGADEEAQRTFGLDAYGRRVYDSCDGRQPVRAIVRRFAQQTHLSVPEAEISVTRFIRTLLAKGLLAMKMEKPHPCPK